MNLPVAVVSTRPSAAKMVGAVVLACVVIGTWAAWSGREVEDWAYLIGMEAPELFIGTLLFWAFTKSWHVRGLTLSAFLAMSVTVAIVAVAHRAIARQEATTFVSEIRAAAQTSPNRAGSFPTTLPVSTQVSGGVGELSKVFQTWVAEAKQLNSAYMTTLSATGIEQDLSAEKPGEIDAASIRRDMDRARAVVAKFQKANDDLLASFPTRVRAAPISEALKTSALEGFQRSADAKKVVRDEFWNTERSVIDASQNLLEFLVARKDWTRDANKQLLFKSNEDVAGYNALYTALQSAASRETKVLAEIQAMENAQLDALQTQVAAH